MNVKGPTRIVPNLLGKAAQAAREAEKALPKEMPKGQDLSIARRKPPIPAPNSQREPNV